MTLYRYILSQVIWPVLATLLALNALFLIVQLLKIGEMTFGAGFGWFDLILVAVLMLPGFAVLTIPISVLAGVLLGYGRLAEDGELVALSASGNSPWRLALVPALIGLVAAGASAVVAGWVAPAAADTLHTSLVELAKRHVVASLEPGRFFEEIPRVMLYPHKSAGPDAHFDGFLLYDHRPGKVRHALVANRARLAPDEAGDRIELSLSAGQVHSRNPETRTYSLAGFEKATIGLDIGRLIYDRTKFIPQAARLSLAQLANPPPGLSPRDKDRRSASWHRRFAFPLASLVFSLLGSALAVSGLLGGAKRTLLIALLVVAAYYLLVRMADVLIEQQLLGPGTATWMPNVLLAVLVGFWLVRRTRVPG